MARSVSGRRGRPPNGAGASWGAVKIEIASYVFRSTDRMRLSPRELVPASARVSPGSNSPQRRPATHNTRDAAYGIPRRTHYDDICRIPPRSGDVNQSPSRPAVSPAATATAASAPRRTSPAGSTTPAAAPVPIGRSLSARTRLVDHQRAALVLFPVHGRDGVGGFFRRHLHKPEPARGNETRLRHRAPGFEQGPQI